MACQGKGNSGMWNIKTFQRNEIPFTDRTIIWIYPANKLVNKRLNVQVTNKRRRKVVIIITQLSSFQSERLIVRVSWTESETNVKVKVKLMLLANIVRISFEKVFSSFEIEIRNV